MVGRGCMLRALSTAAIFGCATLLAVTVVLFRSPSSRVALGLTRVPRPSYAVGDRLTILPLSGSLNTVVLFARSTCVASRQAEDALTAVVASARGRARVLLATANPASPAERAFAARLGLGPQDLIPYGAAAGRLQRVPAVIVAGEHGDVRFAWEAPQPLDGLVQAVTALLW